jgi:hypothetical protein
MVLPLFCAVGMGASVSAGMDGEVAAQLLLFAEQTADFVGVADAWGRVVYLNPAARELNDVRAS